MRLRKLVNQGTKLVKTYDFASGKTSYEVIDYIVSCLPISCILILTNEQFVQINPLIIKYHGGCGMDLLAHESPCIPSSFLLLFVSAGNA